MPAIPKSWSRMTLRATESEPVEETSESVSSSSQFTVRVRFKSSKSLLRRNVRSAAIDG